MSRNKAAAFALMFAIMGGLVVGCGQEPVPGPTIVRLPPRTAATPTPPPASSPTRTPEPTEPTTPTSTPTATPMPPTNTPVPTATPRPHSATRTPTPGLVGRFVFQVASGGDIYTLNADGTNLTRLSDGMDPSWSSDGSKIALSRWITPGGNYAISADGSNERLLVSCNVPRSPDWSTDGTQIALFFETEGCPAPWRGGDCGGAGSICRGAN